MTTYNGARWSSYSAFLKKERFRSNLHVVTHAHVQKILIDESKQAYGVQYTKHGRTVVVSVTKEIILSAGTLGSAKILMLSGVGKKEDLEPLGVRYSYICYKNIYTSFSQIFTFQIKVHSERQVGENLQDHIYVPLTPLIHNDSSASLVEPLDVKVSISFKINTFGFLLLHCNHYY